MHINLRKIKIPEKIMILLTRIFYAFCIYTILFIGLIFLCIMFAILVPIMLAFCFDGGTCFLFSPSYWFHQYILYMIIPITFSLFYSLFFVLCLLFFYLIEKKGTEKNNRLQLFLNSIFHLFIQIGKLPSYLLEKGNNTLNNSLKSYYLIGKNYVILSSILYIAAMMCFSYNLLVGMLICTFFLYILTLKRATLFGGTFQYFSYISFFFISLPFWGAIVILLYASPAGETPQKK